MAGFSVNDTLASELWGSNASIPCLLDANQSIAPFKPQPLRVDNVVGLPKNPGLQVLTRLVLRVKGAAGIIHTGGPGPLLSSSTAIPLFVPSRMRPC